MSYQANQSAIDKRLRVEIFCGKGADEYQVILTGKSLDVFTNASRLPEVVVMKDEALIAAIVASGGILEIARRKNNKYNDGANGEPALQTFHENGAPNTIARYKDGKRNDGPNGEPAIEHFDASGKLIYQAHYNTYGTMVSELTKAQIDEHDRQKAIRAIRTAIPGLSVHPESS